VSIVAEQTVIRLVISPGGAGDGEHQVGFRNRQECRIKNGILERDMSLGPSHPSGRSLSVLPYN